MESIERERRQVGESLEGDTRDLFRESSSCPEKLRRFSVSSTALLFPL